MFFGLFDQRNVLQLFEGNSFDHRPEFFDEGMFWRGTTGILMGKMKDIHKPAEQEQAYVCRWHFHLNNSLKDDLAIMSIFVFSKSLLMSFFILL